VAEVCSGYDDDCDGSLLPGEDDEGDGVLTCSGFVDVEPYDTFIGTDDCDTLDPTRYQRLDLHPDRDLDGHGVATTSSICAGETTPAGWSTTTTDCDDGDPFRYLGAPEIPSDGIDQGCAGDGDLVLDDASAVYVNGACRSPCGAGTRASPFTAIGSAVFAAAASGRVVVVAEGKYLENVTTTVSLFGGYSADFSEHDPVAHVTRMQHPTYVPVRVVGGAVVVSGFTLSYTGTAIGVSLYADGGAITAVDDVLEITGGSTIRAVYLASLPFHGTGLTVRATMTSTRDAYGIEVTGAGHFYLENSLVEMFTTGNGSTTGISALQGGTVGIVRGSTIRGAAAPIATSAFRAGYAIQWGPDLRPATTSSLYLEGNDIRAGSRARSDAVYMRYARLESVGNFVSGALADDESIAISAPGLGHALVVNDVLVGGNADARSGTSSGIAPPSHGFFVNDTIVAGNAGRSHGISGAGVHTVWVNDVVVTGTGTSVYGLAITSSPAPDVTLAYVDFYGPAMTGLVGTYPFGSVTSPANVDGCTWTGCDAAIGTVSVAPSFVGGTPFDYHLTSAIPGGNPSPYYTGALDDVDMDGDPRPGPGGVWERGADEQP
jgi:hypothetical protein